MQNPIGLDYEGRLVIAYKQLHDKRSIGKSQYTYIYRARLTLLASRLERRVPPDLPHPSLMDGYRQGPHDDQWGI